MEQDLDYIRALLEVDQELAIKTIPGLKTPCVGYYFLESNYDGCVLKFATCMRQNLIDIILEDKIKVMNIF